MTDKFAILICKEDDHKDEYTKVMGPYDSERKAQQIADGVEVNLSGDWYVLIEPCTGDEDWLASE